MLSLSLSQVRFLSSLFALSLSSGSAPHLTSCGLSHFHILSSLFCALPHFRLLSSFSALSLFSVPLLTFCALSLSLSLLGSSPHFFALSSHFRLLSSLFALSSFSAPLLTFCFLFLSHFACWPGAPGARNPPKRPQRPGGVAGFGSLLIFAIIPTFGLILTLAPLPLPPPIPWVRARPYPPAL